MIVRSFTRFTATLAATACFAAAVPAFAETFESNGRTAEVRFADLDLSQADGQQELRQRITRAANKVCVERDLNQQAACAARARANVKAKTDAVIARAETNQRYADAGKTTNQVMVGN